MPRRRLFGRPATEEGAGTETPGTRPGFKRQEHLS